MLSMRQIKAARALLGWTQADLAQKTDLSLKALNAIEKGMSAPRSSTLAAIEAAFKEGGAKFLDNDGVQLAGEVLSVQKLEGKDMMRLLTDDILSVMQDTSFEKLTLSPTLSVFELGDGLQRERYVNAQKTMGFRERILVPHTLKDTPRIAKVQYRSLPEDALGKLTYLIYGDRHAVILPKQQVCLITRSQTLADAQKEQFNFLWSIGQDI